MGSIKTITTDTARAIFYNTIVSQIEFELASQVKYYNMAQVFDDLGMKNLAKFFFQQATEENQHALKFMKFLSDNGILFEIGTIEVSELSLNQEMRASERVLQCFHAALDQEKQVTAKIHVLFDIVKEHGYFEAESLLSWFTEEQMEEEDTMQSLVDLFKISENNLLLLDNSDYVRELLVAE